MANIQAARMHDAITRAELAKVISQYATQVLGKTPNTSKDCSAFLNSIAAYTNDLHGFMIMACQLEIMGINPDGTPLDNFRPNDFVTRAEFGTVLSRLLRGDAYEYENGLYYTYHLNALREARIITNIDPTLQELRGWIFLQLLRVASEGLLNINNANETPDLPEVLNPLSGTQWNLLSFSGEYVTGDYTLSFTATEVSAKFCNTIAGTYTLDGETIRAELAQTLMACIDDESMELEELFNLDGATFTIASTRMLENNIERLAIMVAEGHSFLWSQAEPVTKESEEKSENPTE
jgi:hypothetical protein